MANSGFHLSIAVPDLEAARRFYRDVLGCEIGLDRGTWLNVDLFGHQLTLHQAGHHRFATPVDHFGPFLAKDRWRALAEHCAEEGVPFRLAPTVLDEGTPRETGKFVIRDPAGNLIEFKYRAAAAG